MEGCVLALYGGKLGCCLFVLHAYRVMNTFVHIIPSALVHHGPKETPECLKLRGAVYRGVLAGGGNVG